MKSQSYPMHIITCEYSTNADFHNGILCFELPYFFGYKTEFFLPKQSQRSRSVLQDGSRSFGLFRKGKIGIIAKFHRTDLVI